MILVKTFREGGSVNKLILILLLLISHLIHADIYVDQSATGIGDGSSWADAFTSIQAAVDASSENEVILVAEGTYETSDEITINHALSIKGGYPTGGGGQSITSYPTVIEALIPTPVDRHRVIQANHFSGLLFLEGLTVQNGNTNSGDNGGGINTTGDLYLNYVHIFNNSAQAGGGVFSQAGNITAVHSSFSNNEASDSGGGVYASNGQLLLINVLVSENTVSPNMFNTPAMGGGVYSGDGNMILVNTQVSYNSASTDRGVVDGGGLYNDFGDLLVINCQINDNTASSIQSVVRGGGLFNDNSEITVVNSLVHHNEIISQANSIIEGGGIYSSGVIFLINSAVIGNKISAELSNSFGAGVLGNTVLRNSALWGNTEILATPSEHDGGTLVTEFSMVKGQDLTSEDGINASDPSFDPLFADEENGNFSLLLGSPLIDTGDFNLLPLDDFDVDGDGDFMELLPLDLDGYAREVGSNVDIGPYEFGDLIFRDGFE